MKLKKIIASTMALLCFSSANMITYAVETDIEDDVYVVKSGIVTPLIPEDIACLLYTSHRITIKTVKTNIICFHSFDSDSMWLLRCKSFCKFKSCCSD